MRYRDLSDVTRHRHSPILDTHTLSQFTHATVPLQSELARATHQQFPHDALGPSPMLCRLTASVEPHRRLQRLARRRGGAWARRGKESVRLQTLQQQQKQKQRWKLRQLPGQELQHRA